jgi:hypothetical protein
LNFNFHLEDSHDLEQLEPIHGKNKITLVFALEESLSITTGRCDLAIATHARKMHKNLFVVVHLEVLDND